MWVCACTYGVLQSQLFVVIWDFLGGAEASVHRQSSRSVLQVGPKPSTFSGQRALDFVLFNKVGRAFPGGTAQVDRVVTEACAVRLPPITASRASGHVPCENYAH